MVCFSLTGLLTLNRFISRCNMNYTLSLCSHRRIHWYVAPTLRALKKRQDMVQSETRLAQKDKRSTFAEWNLSAEVFAFGQRLQEHFKPELLIQAFIHRSYIEEEQKKQQEVGIGEPALTMKDNAELARLGTEITSKYVKRYLAHVLPKFPAEGIEAVHDFLLSEDVLADTCKNLGTSELILSTDYPVASETFAQTMLAVVGALAESQSVDRANLFVRDFLITRLASVDVNDLFVIEEPLSVLQDILSREGRGTAEPRIISESAVGTVLAVYHVGIYCDKLLIGKGPGETVETAINIAAQDALRQLFNTSDSDSPISFQESTLTSPRNLPLREWVSNPRLSR